MFDPTFALLKVPENEPETSSPSTRPEYETLEVSNVADVLPS